MRLWQKVYPPDGDLGQIIYFEFLELKKRIISQITEFKLKYILRRTYIPTLCTLRYLLI